jgi:hypothetical protein
VQHGVAAIKLYFVELRFGQQALKVADKDVFDLFAF